MRRWVKHGSVVALVLHAIGLDGGLAVGIGLLAALYPDAGQAADQVVVPTDERDPAFDHRA